MQHMTVPPCVMRCDYICQREMCVCVCVQVCTRMVMMHGQIMTNVVALICGSNPALFGSFPAAVSLNPALLGLFPAAANSNPALLGLFPAAVSLNPALLGSFPAAESLTPALLGSFPAAVGSSPALFGSFPAAAIKVHGRAKIVRVRHEHVLVALRQELVQSARAFESRVEVAVAGRAPLALGNRRVRDHLVPLD